MGLESEDLHGVHPKDIVKAMEGCIKERYKFNPSCPISSQDEGYRSNPTLQDQTYCLVFVLAGDSISRMNEAVIEKMKYIRNKANELEIPQAVVMTRVDEACPLVKENLRNIYKSKKIQEKLEKCSELTGVSLSQVFPVKSYHKEIDTQEDIDVLILRAFADIVQVANDALEIKSMIEKTNE
ncbi:interferon-induced 44-like protein [Labeo rohita]|uniref:Interferon-induced 44-like protein n=2 Tax=Labeo rohita TaxID=84645 RepID=A0A498L390_LABRO|nr:interferon-induced 44-like protein [Labeo rohita]RXN14119.1 interferon-induced 44-like protein [Labeo rohita]